MPELNLDGLVGPTHNYAGISYGNVASATNQGAASQPRRAARQGLAKMAAVAALGVPQGYLLPHERPHLPTLRRLGYSGSDEEVVDRAGRDDPILLARCSSASAMWTANAATVTPSTDAADGRVHFTPANLRTMFHRSLEPRTTAAMLRAAFPDPRRFAIHDPLPGGGTGVLMPPTGAAGAQVGDVAGAFGDEGAANHTRLTRSHDPGGEVPGVHLFVFGNASGAHPGPRIFPARQTADASRAVARLHGIPAERLRLAQQNPDAIDRGVFHNDVICVGNGCVLFHHERAFAEPAATLDALRAATDGALLPVTVTGAEASVDDAVRTYLFNSQLLTRPDGRMVLVAPAECREHPRVAAVLERVVADPGNPIAEVVAIDVRESMRNGGGPACLRLRVPLTAAEMSAMNPAFLFEPSRHAALEALVERAWPESIEPSQLRDPQLLRASRDALEALTRLFGLGSFYDFQR